MKNLGQKVFGQKKIVHRKILLKFLVKHFLSQNFCGRKLMVKKTWCRNILAKKVLNLLSRISYLSKGLIRARFLKIVYNHRSQHLCRKEHSLTSISFSCPKGALRNFCIFWSKTAIVWEILTSGNDGEMRWGSKRFFKNFHKNCCWWQPEWQPTATPILLPIP